MIKVTCDFCSSDLSETSNCEDYRIEIKSVRIPSHHGAVTDMAVTPQFSGPLSFCSEGCMRAYFFRNNEKQ